MKRNLILFSILLLPMLISEARIKADDSFGSGFLGGFMGGTTSSLMMNAARDSGDRDPYASVEKEKAREEMREIREERRIKRELEREEKKQLREEKKKQKENEKLERKRKREEEKEGKRRKHKKHDDDEEIMIPEEGSKIEVLEQNAIKQDKLIKLLAEQNKEIIKQNNVMKNKMSKLEKEIEELLEN